MGELAVLFNTHFGIGADLEVVELAGWTRPMYHDETRLPWVMPSPNLPTLESAVVYPGAVLFEGTSVSEGRGTTRPFELLGAPGVDADRLAARLAGRGLPGVVFRPASFEPTFQKHAGRVCGGCQLHVTDRTRFAPVRTAVTVMHAIRAVAPAALAWRDPPYEYEREKAPIDILAGSSALRTRLDAGDDPDAIADAWTADVDAFDGIRRRVLRYD